MGILLLSFLLTTLVVFITLFLLFKKFSSKKLPLSNFWYWISSFIATPLVYAGVIFVWFLISSSFEKKEFDKEIWLENRDIRYVYVDDLIDGKKLIGLTSDELKTMLGEVDYEDDSTILFYIGYSPKVFLNMNPDWLETYLVDGKVGSALIRY